MPVDGALNPARGTLAAGQQVSAKPQRHRPGALLRVCPPRCDH